MERPSQRSLEINKVQLGSETDWAFGLCKRGMIERQRLYIDGAFREAVGNADHPHLARP
jgi:hypothetical protein